VNQAQPSSPLQHELETYRKLLPTLLDHAGRFAVIAADRLIGVFSTWEDAAAAGYKEVGLNRQFLIKKIEVHESINSFTRDLTFPCRM
jgi:hypothetical protein